ncbi:MAG TPA: peptidoglycan editing factor PgeF [Chloroflexia bacterium]|nr:peptidoglycan editing factor PgeF [Chloroflexia bacterium]
MARSLTGASISAPATVAAPIYLLAGFAAYPALVQGCSTRRRPAGPWGAAADWNLKRRGADPATAEANWQAFAAQLGVPAARMVAPEQVHGTMVAVATAADAGLGTMAGNRGIAGADALVTQTPGLLLLSGCADCVPVFVYDPHTPALGLAHAGWQGTVGRIAEKTVATMVAAFGTDPAACVAVIGPSIGPCCYDVGGAVVEAIRDAYPGADDEWHGAPPLLVWSRRRPAWKEAQGLPAAEPESDEKPFLDLWQANYRALVDAGLAPENVRVEGLCTAEMTDLFYSHRAEQGRAGRFVGFLGLPER